jgi:hypothetical protein
VNRDLVWVSHVLEEHLEYFGGEGRGATLRIPSEESLGSVLIIIVV